MFFSFREMRMIGFLVACLLQSAQSFSQRLVVNQNQLWVGYMTSTELSKHYAWWNDFHYVPEGFLVVRTGLTRNFKVGSLTAGYAHLWLPVSAANKQLGRNENRPWAQFLLSVPISPTLLFTQRTRYEARFKQNVLQGETIDEYTFANRIRLMGSLKKSFPGWGDEGSVPFLALSDEVLFNFGKNIAGDFVLDQNRVYVTLGIQKPRIQYQVGYMNRMVQITPNHFVQNHTLLIWVTQKFSLREKDRKS